MKQTFFALAFLFASGTLVLAQEQKQEQETASYQVSAERILFPKNSLRGYVDFSFAPRGFNEDVFVESRRWPFSNEEGGTVVQRMVIE